MMHRENSGVHAQDAIEVRIYRYKGFLIGLLAMSFYSCSTLNMTVLKGDLNPLMFSVFRQVVMAVLCFISLIYKNIPVWPCTRKEMLLTFLSSCTVTITVPLQFHSYHIMHPANASAIMAGYITFVAFFARIFLKERFGPLEAVAILATLAGVLLIAQPPFIFGSQHTDDHASADDLGGVIPALIALTGSVTAAMVAVNFRAIGRENIPTLKTLFWHSIFSILILLPVITFLQKWSIPVCTLPRLLTVIAVVTAFLGTFCMAYALSLENAVYVGLATMNEVYVIFIADVLFFGLKPNWINILGIFLIVGSSTVIILKKGIDARREAQNAKRIESNGKGTLHDD